MHAASGFPLAHTNLPRDELLALLKEHLPTYERATALAEAYLENISWLPRPIQREQIMEELLPLIYKGKYLDPSSRKDESVKYDGRHRMHNLALALALFACGAAGDLTLPPNNQEGKMYHALSLAAMSTHSVMSPGGASLETVQAIILIAQYDFFSCEKPTLESGWKVVSFALIVAASVCISADYCCSLADLSLDWIAWVCHLPGSSHELIDIADRDPAHWKLEPKYVQRRRYIFWEIFCLDKFKVCFGMNRINCLLTLFSESRDRKTVNLPHARSGLRISGRRGIIY